MISYVLNMILHVISLYHIIFTFCMKYIMKSYMISYLYDFILVPARAGSNAVPGRLKSDPIRFKCTPVRIKFNLVMCL